MQENEINKLVSHLFRHEAGKMAAVLTRILSFHSVPSAEDIVQETLLQAMSVWRYKGVPENPSGWLYKVAKRKAIDTIRQQKNHEHHNSQLSSSLRSEWTLSNTVSKMFLEDEIQDSQLRMMFVCCHPSIPYESQLALMLKTLCGLSAKEIAYSFLTNEEAITKRIYRAKEKIKEEKINLDSPAPANIPGRLDAVLHTLYLLFNEGYNSSHTTQLIRHDLCEEAMRLCMLMANHKSTSLASAKALLALMCFQASRAEARIDEDGGIILLKEQDRSKWNKDLIEKGKYFLERSATGKQLSEYHLEAAIAGCHATAPSFDETDWASIIKLYTTLLSVRPSAIVEMNKAIAVGYGRSIEAGLNELLKINDLGHHHLYHAAVGDFYVMLKDFNQALVSYAKAFQLTSSMAEKKLLEKKMSTIEEKITNE